MSNAISAVASLLWPLVVLVALVVFRNPLTRLLRQRDFTVKIAGQEVSVSDLSQQTTAMITDLQKQLAALEKQVAGQGGDKPAPAPAPTGQPTPPAATTGPTTPAATTPGSTTAGALPAAPAGSAAAPSKPASTSPSTASRSTQKVAAVGDKRPSEPVPARNGAAQADGDALDIGAGPAPWDRWDQLPEDPADVDRPLPEPVPDSWVGGSSRKAAANPTYAEPRRAEAEPRSAADFLARRPKATGVLWVDDQPQQVAVEIARLQNNSVPVDVARSTEDALNKLSGHRYELIVSDMSRVENGQPVPDAGQRLAHAVRALDQDTPLVIYTDVFGVDKYGRSAEQAGASMVTSSAYELAREFDRMGLV